MNLIARERDGTMRVHGWGKKDGLGDVGQSFGEKEDAKHKGGWRY